MTLFIHTLFIFSAQNKQAKKQRQKPIERMSQSLGEKISFYSLLENQLSFSYQFSLRSTT